MKPSTVACADCAPAVGPSTRSAAASPSAPVSTVTGEIEPPPLTLHVTSTLATGFPSASVAFTTSESASAEFTGPVWSSPLTPASTLPLPARAVAVNRDLERPTVAALRRARPQLLGAGAGPPRVQRRAGKTIRVGRHGLGLDRASAAGNDEGRPPGWAPADPRYRAPARSPARASAAPAGPTCSLPSTIGASAASPGSGRVTSPPHDAVSAARATAIEKTRRWRYGLVTSALGQEWMRAGEGRCRTGRKKAGYMPEGEPCPADLMSCRL